MAQKQPGKRVVIGCGRRSVPGNSGTTVHRSGGKEAGGDVLPEKVVRKLLPPGMVPEKRSRRTPQKTVRRKK